MGLVTALSSGRSADGGGRGWSRSGRTQLRRPSAGAELQPPSLCSHQLDRCPGKLSWGLWHQRCWSSAPCSFFGGGPTGHRLSHCGEWGASPAICGSPQALARQPALLRTAWQGRGPKRGSLGCSVHAQLGQRMVL